MTCCGKSKPCWSLMPRRVTLIRGVTAKTWCEPSIPRSHKRASAAQDKHPCGPPNFHQGKTSQAFTACRPCWKHSRHSTGRPCVGRNGTVVSFPHCEQLVRVSVFA